MDFKIDRRVFLVFVFCAVAVFNAAVYSILQPYFIEPDYSQMDSYMSQVRDSKIEITKEKYLTALEQKKVVFESTDSIIVGYQYILKILVAVNLICVAVLCLTWWRDLGKTLNENS